MIKKIFKYIPLLILVLTASCADSNKNKATFFGGKIINPKTKYVVLFAMDKVIDTILLDNKNKFLGKFNSLNEGLYYFEHGNENQYIYLEPNDSLMLRLNTWDFDESLVYAGKGAERNNILVDIFLEDENDGRSYYKLNKLKPNAYKRKIDSILNVRLETYKTYAENHTNETDNYFKLLKIALTYPIYSRIERYPINHKRINRENNFIQVEKSFYDYRNHIDFNNDSLMYYTPYTKYIRNYLYNITYALGHKPLKNQYSSDFTVDLLKSINDKISSENSRNAFLKSTVLDHFYRKSSCSINKETFDAFFKYSTNEKDKNLINNILNDGEALHRGDEIKDFIFFDFTEQPINVQDFVINKNSLLVFWNEDYFSKEFLSSRIPYLKNKFPDLNIAVIEIDGNSLNRIPNVDIKNQYYINTKNLKNNFLTSGMPRTILVNKNGIVENGYASIASQNIYYQLKQLTKNN
ncbi:hypothetical protein [Polaribacter sp.]|uniref:hypothetical protein n=1 Tax=Polaribacter sp. TaxID=1920175 RepID=UPI003F6AE3E7